MKDMRISIDTNIVLTGRINSDHGIGPSIFNLNDMNNTTSISLPIIIGMDKSVYNNLWYVSDPALVRITDLVCNFDESDILRIERHPHIGVYFIYYKDEYVLGLALSGEIINDTEYCNIDISYNENVFKQLYTTIPCS